MNNPNRYEIAVFSKKENLTQIENFLDEVSKKLTIGEELYGKIFLAVMEASNNAIVHGNKENEQKKVSIIFQKNEKDITIIIKDEGDGFDYENIPDPTLPENIEKINGRGIFIIKNLADELTFEENGSEMQLIFNL